MLCRKKKCNVAMEELNNAIAKFSQDVSYQDAEATLLPILQTVVLAAAHDDDDDKNNHHHPQQKEEERADGSMMMMMITPLMIACDKGQTETVRFLVNHNNKVGCGGGGCCLTVRVDQKAPESWNTPVHYAAMSGKVEILKQLQLLAAFANTEKEKQTAKTSGGDMIDSNHQSEYETTATLVTLGSLQNIHGDTPIMMVCVNGYEELLTYWLSHCDDDDDGSNSKRRMLQLRNESNDSALSLACGHGHVGIVQLILLLLQDDNVAQQDDLESAEAALFRINHVLKQQQQLKLPTKKEQLQQLQTKREDIQQCVNLVRAALQRKADAMAQELMGGDTEPTTTTTKPARKTKSKNKSNKKTQKKSVRLVKDKPLTGEKKDRDENPEAVILTQLEDGTRAVVVQGTSLQEERTFTTSFLRTQQQQQSSNKKSVDDLFRERVVHNDIDDIMKALCLDVSQLLLSPHGMALNLSPSQLDAVDQILERQRAAVQQAREIQARLHATAQHTTV